jgi:RNA polymerase sigma factor (TIGR02999 family)
MSTDFSARLAAARDGDADAFADAFEAAYDQLRRLARRQLRALRPGDTIGPTALVNEAFLKLAGHGVACEDRTHFFALAARAMRQVLVDYARERGAQKRGGDWHRTTLDAAAIPVEAIAEEMLGIDRALTALEPVTSTKPKRNSPGRSRTCAPDNRRARFSATRSTPLVMWCAGGRTRPVPRS